MSSMIFGLCRVVKLLLLLFEADEGVSGTLCMCLFGK